MSNGWGGGTGQLSNFWCQVQICWNPKFLMSRGWGRSTFLMLSPNLLKSQTPYVQLGGGGVGQLSNFWCWVQILLKSQNSYVSSCDENFLNFFHKKCAIPSCPGQLQMVPCILCVRGSIKKTCWIWLNCLLFICDRKITSCIKKYWKL